MSAVLRRTVSGPDGCASMRSCRVVDGWGQHWLPHARFGARQRGHVLAHGTRSDGCEGPAGMGTGERVRWTDSLASLPTGP